jgi:hypothetical protein
MIRVQCRPEGPGAVSVPGTEFEEGYTAVCHQCFDGIADRVTTRKGMTLPQQNPSRLKPAASRGPARPRGKPVQQATLRHSTPRPAPLNRHLGCSIPSNTRKARKAKGQGSRDTSFNHWLHTNAHEASTQNESERNARRDDVRHFELPTGLHRIACCPLRRWEEPTCILPPS